MSVDLFAQTKNLDLKTKKESIMISITEEDFEAAYNKIFKENEPLEDKQDQDREIENKCYYIQNIFTKNEDSFHMYKIYNNLEFIKDKNSNIEGINEKKVDYIEANDEKEIKKIEMDIKEEKDEVKKIKIDDEKKVELNNIPTKKNIFRTDNYQNFNIFHPGGIVEYFKNIKDEMREETLNKINKDGKFSQNHFKFNVYIKNNNQIYKKKIKKKY